MPELNLLPNPSTVNDSPWSTIAAMCSNESAPEHSPTGIDVKSIETARNTSTREINSLRSTCDTFITGCAAIEKAIATMKIEYDDLEAESEHVKDESEKLKALHSDLKTSYDELRSENKVLKAEKKAIVSKHAALICANDSFTAHLATETKRMQDNAKAIAEIMPTKKDDKQKAN